LALAAEQAQLLLQKTLTSTSDFPGLFAQDRNLNVTLNVFNVGNGHAYGVVVNDEWPAEGFDVVFGEKSVTFGEIAAGERKSHNFTVKPKFSGEFEGFPATVQYHTHADAKDFQTGFSTPMRNLTIVSTAFYEKVTAKHVAEWTVFGVWGAGIVLMPLVSYLLIQSNYEHGLPKKKAA